MGWWAAGGWRGAFFSPTGNPCRGRFSPSGGPLQLSQPGRGEGLGLHPLGQLQPLGPASHCRGQPSKRRTSGRGGGPLLLQLLITLQGGIGQGLQIRRQQAPSGQPLHLRTAREALPVDHFGIIEQ